MAVNLVLAIVTALSLQAPDDPFAASFAMHVQEAAPEPLADEESGSRWIDPEDGWFDISSFLELPHGFVPLIVPITEPALGYGAFGAAVFLDPREEAGSEGWARPNITMVGGMATENGSDGFFAGNSSLWAGGDVQTLVAGGKFGLELELHGIGEDEALDHDPLDYSLDSVGLLGEVRLRLGRSHFWGALRFAYVDATVDFDGSPAAIPGLDPGDADVTIAGPTLTLRYHPSATTS